MVNAFSRVEKLRGSMSVDFVSWPLSPDVRINLNLARIASPSCLMRSYVECVWSIFILLNNKCGNTFVVYYVDVIHKLLCDSKKRMDRVEHLKLSKLLIYVWDCDNFGTAK